MPYVALFIIVFVVIGILIWRAYQPSKFARGFGTDNVLGARLGAVWGVMFLIASLTMLRLLRGRPVNWRRNDTKGVVHQVQLSQVAPVLEVVASLLWQIMAPWFPAQFPVAL